MIANQGWNGDWFNQMVGMPDGSLAPVCSLTNGAGTAPFSFGATGAGGVGGLGLNMPTVGLALGGLQAIGSLWGASKANSLARDQFNFAKKVTNTNLDNQTKAYNTTLEDRARSRAVMEGQSDQQRDDYIARNRLSR